jgi:hypothetical protein
MAEFSRAELLEAKQRWALVNQAERRALRDTTLEQKLEELERLFLSIDDFGWRAALDDDSEVREIWSRLRRKLGATRSGPSEA